MYIINPSPLTTLPPTPSRLPGLLSACVMVTIPSVYDSWFLFPPRRGKNMPVVDLSRVRAGGVGRKRAGSFDATLLRRADVVHKSGYSGGLLFRSSGGEVSNIRGVHPSAGVFNAAQIVGEQAVVFCRLLSYVHDRNAVKPPSLYPSFQGGIVCCTAVSPPSTTQSCRSSRGKRLKGCRNVVNTGSYLTLR